MVCLYGGLARPEFTWPTTTCSTTHTAKTSAVAGVFFLLSLILPLRLFAGGFRQFNLFLVQLLNIITITKSHLNVENIKNQFILVGKRS